MVPSKFHEAVLESTLRVLVRVAGSGGDRLLGHRALFRDEVVPRHSVEQLAGGTEACMVRHRALGSFCRAAEGCAVAGMVVPPAKLVLLLLKFASSYLRVFLCWLYP